MSTLIVAGSPREKMFSDRIAAMLSELTGDEVVHLRSLKVGPCHGCNYCKEINEGSCLQKDDMRTIYNRFREADTVAIISPIYWWQVTAQTKLFMDRLYALEREAWEGKKFIVVLNGAAEDDDVEFDILHSAFNEMIPYMNANLFFLGVGTQSEEDFESKKEKIQGFLSDALRF